MQGHAYSSLPFYPHQKVKLKKRVSERFLIFRKLSSEMSNFENENGQQQQIVEEYVETDGQYVIDADGNQQFYGEYVEVESEVALEYEQPEVKPQITGLAMQRSVGMGSVGVRSSSYGARSAGYGYSPAASIRPQHFAPAMTSSPYYGAGAFRQSRPLPTFRYSLPISMHRTEAVAYPPLMLTGFPTRHPKPTKSRRSVAKRKPCNCTKSQCLKLYCDCFANGEFCLDCNCKDCHNNLEHEAERSRAIKASLEKNPSAFKPKIGVAAKSVGKALDMERLHQRGCHCKRSNCLKNYCECYEAKVPCTDRCKCNACKNTEHDRHHKFKDKFSTTAGGLAQLAAAAAADKRARSGSPCSEDDASDVCVVDGKLQRQQQLNPKAQPWFYMTEDVIEATTMCLVAQAQEYEHTLSEEDLERSVLKEFGRCLEQIIESTGSSTNGSHQQQMDMTTMKSPNKK